MPVPCSARHPAVKERYLLIEQPLSQPLLPHLTPRERLACFQASKGLGDLVATNGPRTGLRLNLGVSTGRLGNRPPNSPTNAVIAQQLAASSKDVALTLHKGLCSPAPCLWQAITTLSLERVLLSEDDFSSTSRLQLSNLPHLHTLRLKQCRMFVSQTGQSSSTAQHVDPAPNPACPAVRSLEVIHDACNGPRHNLDPQPVRIPFIRALSLLDPAQLQTLITDDRAAVEHLPQMTALQELHLLLDRPGVDDQAFQVLLQHPQLLRVTLKDTTLTEDHSAAPCRWESLSVDSPTLATLAALPLANIQHLTVSSELSTPNSEAAAADGVVQAAVRNVASCPRVVFQPSSDAGDWGHYRPGLRKWFKTEPAFRLTQHDGYDSPQVSAAMLTMALQHMAPGGALTTNCDVTRPEALAALAAAPPTLTTICFMSGGGDVLQSGVVTYLPNVTHVVLTLPVEEQVYPQAWLSALNVHVSGVDRSLKLTLCDAPFPYERDWHRGWECVDRFLCLLHGLDYRWLD